MSDEIDEIRRSLSVERLIKRQATDWKDQSGGDRVGRCTHPEHGHTSSSGGTPNLIVTDDGGWYCYSHSTGGGIFEWIAVEENICKCRDLPLSDDEFREALEEAAERADVELENGPSPDTFEEAQELDTLSDREMAQYALEEAVDILHDNLDSLIGDQTVRGLIKERRPFTDEMIDEAKVGYLDDQAHAELLERLSQDALQDIGLHRDNNSLHGRNRIIYPYFENGRPSFWIGRKTEESEMDAKYLKPSSETTVFEQPIYSYESANATKGEAVWIVEGIQDAIALAEHGNTHAISAVATNPSPKQMNQLVSRGQDVGSAVVCFDSDEGGQSDSISLALDLMSAGVQTSMVALPEGTDPNDYFLDGGSFSDLEPQAAAKTIIEQKGDSDALIERILDTASPGTARGERLVDAISQVSPIRKQVLRNMMEEEREYENQRGWREPSMVKKTKSDDPTFTFVYPDGSEIEMESLAGRRAPTEFADKFGAIFNFVPNLSKQEFNEMVNEWLQEVRVEEVDPLSIEGQVLEQVQGRIQQSHAVEHIDDLAVVGADSIAFEGDNNGTILVPSSTIHDWLDDYDIGLSRAAHILEPVKAGGTKQKRVDGVLKRFWQFDREAISENGYYVPEPKSLPGSDDDNDDEEVESL